MQTSNFKTAGSHEHAVAISIGVPRGWRGRRYTPLAPTWAMLKMSPEEYRAHYQPILDRLDPKTVAAELGPDAILLCWEEFNGQCHRRWVAEWLEAGLGIEVPELGHTRSESLPYLSMEAPPAKPRAPRIKTAKTKTLKLALHALQVWFAAQLARALTLVP